MEYIISVENCRYLNKSTYLKYILKWTCITLGKLKSLNGYTVPVFSPTGQTARTDIIISVHSPGRVNNNNVHLENNVKIFLNSQVPNFKTF